MEKQKIHIWKLPEKTDDIDKLNDITMIHDGLSVKKIYMNKLYDYFNQDYKINNIIEFFENELYNFNNEYNSNYKKLDEALEHYEDLVKELQNKFKDNRIEINDLQKRVNKIIVDNEDISESFISLKDKHDILSSTINNFKNKVFELNSKSLLNSDDIKDLNKIVPLLYDNINYINQSFEPITNQIDSISKYEDLNSKKEIILKRIINEYDKILSIIDYYHHIHHDILEEDLIDKS